MAHYFRSALAALGLAVLAIFVLLGSKIGHSNGLSANGPHARVLVDYPANGTLFPPEITAPVFRWRDADSQSKFWRVEIRFADGARVVRAETDGPKLEIGEIDNRVITDTNRPPELTPEEAEGHTWKPDPKTWESIKKHSLGKPATVVVQGFANAQSHDALSLGSMTFETSSDPVGAPIFYRDVPLIPSQTTKGIISPIPKHSLGLVAWRLRDLARPESQLLMTGASTCVNCHSFSRDGKTMGIDVDGPDNDRGLYALMPVKKQTLMTDASIVKWSTFQGPLGGNLRIGFMSQVSPDGRYVLTTINDPRSQQSGNHRSDIIDRYYVKNFLDYRFLQVFYPTRGVLAWYSRDTGVLQTLPGADDDRYVQAGGVWAPDGKSIIFIRATARPAYPDESPKAEYANDPRETQIQYDLYRIPFNNGKGGTPERILGASENGMSNSFPKVSPDGRWIVFVQAKNGLLMRPDSKLYIVPFEGGVARPLHANTPRMNSWHSFSPNGRWLVFSSKGRSPYTQMYLTHIDEDGNDSPAILIDNATAANRAVNLPEFVNIEPGSWTKLEAPLADFFHQLDTALDLAKAGKVDEAIPEFRKALVLSPHDAKAHYNLGLALQRKGDLEAAAAEFREALASDPTASANTAVFSDLGTALAELGKTSDAIESYEKALKANPDNPRAHQGLAAIYWNQGKTEECLDHARRALAVDPRSAPSHNVMAADLASQGQLAEGIEHARKATELDPTSFQYEFNLGRLLAANAAFPDALTHFARSVELSKGTDPQSLFFLAMMYFENGRLNEAASVALRGADVAEKSGNPDMARDLRQRAAEWSTATR